MGDLSHDERQRIASSILAKYERVAKSPSGQFRYPTGVEGLGLQGYDPALTAMLPAEVLASFAGVGNPLSLGAVRPGERVLDIGCGAGVDTLLAAMLAGPGGLAAGVDFSPAMVVRAEENRRLGRIGNAAFLAASAEALPFGDATFDRVLSNGALNLVPEKERALAEALRVLKPGGGLQVADQMLVGPPAGSREEAVASWFT